MRRMTYDEERFNMTLCKFKKFGISVEISVNAEKLVEFKSNENVKLDLDLIVNSNKIFYDAKKGLIASPEDLEKLFETTNFRKVCEIIITKGELQLTAEYRKKLRDDKYKQIVQLIHKISNDPTTGLPHPITRIENAMNKAKIKIDEFKVAKKQVEPIIKKLSLLMPLNMDKISITVCYQSKYQGKISRLLDTFGKIKSTNYDDKGYVCINMDVYKGMKNQFMDVLSKNTKGEYELTENKK